MLALGAALVALAVGVTLTAWLTRRAWVAIGRLRHRGSVSPSRRPASPA